MGRDDAGATATIRDALAMYLSQHGMSINQFAGISGINAGTLSRVVGGTSRLP
ncbi:helix-turn-helix domain-containing protein [Paenibacillus riograndensis]|uniref:helix-turn-helix domain-containing protein n=1 Tax=Paenibacillus riograndensis TaxID=483937 RepID=UPI00031BFE33